MRAIRFLAFILAVFWCSQVFAQTPIWPEGQERKAKWRGFNAAAVGVNPIIFGDIIKLYYVAPITKGKHMLTRDSNVRFGGYALVSPLLGEIGPVIGISPLLILDLDLYWNQYVDPVHVKFDHIDDPYPTHIINQKEMTVHWGQNFMASTCLKFAAGPIVLLDMFDLEYMWMRDVWFSIEFMTIVDDGWHFTNKLFAFYKFEDGWMFGSMWESFYIFNTRYERHIINFGFLADRKLPLDFSLLFLTGYHIVNPDFDGIRFWTAILKDWDFK